MLGDDTKAELANVALDQVDLSTRARNCLINENISTVGQLAHLNSSQIMRWRNAGRKTLLELQELLGRLGLKLSDDPSKPPPADCKLLAELLSPSSAGENTLSIDLSAANSELQRLLVTRVKDLPFSTRAQNVLIEKGITFVGELVQLNYHDVLRLHNCGRRTLDELAGWLEDHDLAFTTTIHDWSFQTALSLESTHSEAMVKERSQSLLKSIAPDPDCLEDELARIVKAISNERDTSVLTKLWGWNGKLYRTLESVGNEVGLTRERVRQLESRALRRLNKHKMDTPFLHAAIATLKAELPDMDLTLSRKIRERGVSRNDFNIWSIEKAAEIFDLEWPFARLDIGEDTILVRDRDEPRLREVLSVVRRKTSELGCTNTMSLTSEIGIGENRSAVITKLLECSSLIEWLDGPQHEWLYLRDVPRNRLYNLALKVLSVCPRIRVSELRRAVGRSRRLPMVPPTRILGAFVEKFGLGQVEDGSSLQIRIDVRLLQLILQKAKCSTFWMLMVR